MPRHVAATDSSLVPGFGNTPVVKLGDFGESRRLAATSGKRLRRKMSGNIGTSEFMAPEMLVAGAGQESVYNEKVDIWSLGMLLFELLSLDIPYRANGFRSFELPDRIGRGMMPELPSRVPRRAQLLASDTWRVFTFCTEFDAQKRPSAARLYKKLRKLRAALLEPCK